MREAGPARGLFLVAALVAGAGACVAGLSGGRPPPEPSPQAIREFVGRGLTIDPALRELVERKKQEVIEERKREAERRRRMAAEPR